MTPCLTGPEAGSDPAHHRNSIGTCGPRLGLWAGNPLGIVGTPTGECAKRAEGGRTPSPPGPNHWGHVAGWDDDVVVHEHGSL